MRSKRLVAIIITTVLALVSCSRDPNVAKRRYLESGNKYFEKGKYKEARIMYLNAKAKDQRWGPAYYKLGLTALKMGSMAEAVNALRRAVELLPKNDADRRDAVVQLTQIYLQVKREKPYMDEVEAYCKEMLQRDPNSYDGHRLTGDLWYARATELYAKAMRDQARGDVDPALPGDRNTHPHHPRPAGGGRAAAR